MGVRHSATVMHPLWSGRLSRAGEYFPEPRIRQLIGQLLEAISHLKAHRTAASLLKKGPFPAASGEPKAA